VTISPASLGPGSYLRSFSGACTGTNCVVVVNAAASVTANFEVLPQLWYTFDGNGNSTGQLSSSSYTMLAGGSPSYPTGKFGSAISFTGGSYGSVSGMRAVLGNAPQVTIAFWLNVASATYGGGGFAAWSADNRTTAPFGGLQFALQSSTAASVCMSSTSGALLPAGSCVSVSLPTSVGTGWHHFLFQYKGTGLGVGQGAPVNIFIDGATTAYAIINNDATNNPVFNNGMEDVLSLGANGAMMDDMRVYTRTFTAAEHCTAIIGGTWAGTTCTLP